MPVQFKYDEPVRVRHEDLRRLGIVTSRDDQHQKIKAGILRKPYKNKTRGSDSTMQSGAWWYWSDIAEDLNREKQALEAAGK
jgi:hypothetical protein